MPVHIPTCHHLKANGVWCGSPALRGHRFCYFHHQWREDHAAAEPEARNSGAPSLSAPGNSGGPPLSALPLGRQGGVVPPFELPLLEDANAIQVALQRVMQAILNDAIDNRKAGLLLYALQTASSNLKNTHFDHPALDRQAQAEYASADSAEDDDPDPCAICFDDEEGENEENEEQGNEEEQAGEDAQEGNEVENEEDEEGQQQPAAQLPAAIPAGREPTAESRQPTAVFSSATVTAAPADSTKRKGREGQQVFRPTAESRQPRAVFNRTSPLPEHAEELDDKELIKMIRQLAGLT